MLTNRLTKVEEIKINEISDKVIPYINEVIAHSEEEGNYISFAIDYIYNEKGKKDITIDEIVEVINNTFDKSKTREEVSKQGLTSYLMNRGIVYDSTINGFVYNYNKTRADIAAEHLVRYETKKIKKVNDKKFVVEYNKYVIENPYALLNYYNEQENSETAVKEIMSYLKGETNVSKIYKYITKDIVDKIGKTEKIIKIEYIVKDNSVKISKIG